MKAQSIPVIHLIVVRVNELVSLFRSISVHYSLVQSGLVWLRVVLPPFLALSDFLTSRPFFPLPFVSWWKCNQRRASEGMKLKFLSLQFSRRRQRKQGKKLRIDELRKCVIEQVAREIEEVFSDWSPSCLSCDILLNVWLVPLVWLHYDIITSTLMFVQVNSRVHRKIIACCLTLIMVMYIFTSLSRNLWSISWHERCFKRIAVLKRNVLCFDFWYVAQKILL